MSLFPTDWYWLADDGRVFSSARQAVVDETDAGFTAFTADKTKPTRWPADPTGAQTTQSLQEVLTPLGLYVDLTAYAANARYLKETGGIVVAGVNVATDRASQSLIGNAYQLLGVTGATSVDFKGSDGVYTTLTADQFKALAVAVGVHVQACFAAEGQIDAGVAAGTITTQAQVNQALAAVTV